MTTKKKFITYKQGATITDSVLIKEYVTYDAETAAYLAHRKTGYDFIMVYDEKADLFYHCVYTESTVSGPWDVDIIDVTKLAPNGDAYTITTNEDAVEVTVMDANSVMDILTNHDVVLIRVNSEVFIGKDIVITSTPSQHRRNVCNLRMSKDLYAVLQDDLFDYELPFVEN
jgi:hypothetical protein